MCGLPGVGRPTEPSLPSSSSAPIAALLQNAPVTSVDANKADNMKHVFSIIGIGLALVFVVVFFTGRIDSKHLNAVASRVGMHPDELNAIAPRISSRTGATIGTAKRVVYLLACSGVPTSSTMESQALQAADITEKRHMTAREAAVFVLSGTHSENGQSPLKDC